MAPRHRTGKKDLVTRHLVKYFMKDEQPFYYYDGHKDMGQKIEIKPNDQSWVGKLVYDLNGDQYFIRFVGHSHVVLMNDSQNREEAPLLEYLELYEKPEEKCTHKKYNQGLLKEDGKVYCLECDQIIELKTYKLNGITVPEEKKQGHHCTGKCTKLPALDPQTVKAKECEHKFWAEGNLKHEFKEPFKKCVLCEESIFWLKVGDVIRNNLDRIGRIEKIDNERISIFWKYNNGWTEAQVCLINLISPQKFKKIKLVSPALIKNKFGYWRISEDLFDFEPAIFNLASSEEDQLKIKEYFWPAKDQFGKEIWYEVEG